MLNRKVLVITDHEFLYNKFKKIIIRKGYDINKFVFKYSFTNLHFSKKFCKDNLFQSINMKECEQDIINKYKLIISLHCKQIFPKEIVENITCLNVHPGFNPYNRGWFPQVFSIINRYPCGATIHLMDEKIDHGPIIARERVEINNWDTSESVYQKILNLEIKLLEENIDAILEGRFITFLPESKGNINYKKDFQELQKIELDERMTAKEFIDKLRALSHGEYKNAYFVDEDNNRVWLKLELRHDK